MKIAVAIAGVVDPKWPLRIDPGSNLPERAPDRTVMSPFDESALEIALRTRDALPGAAITAIVAGADAEKIGRAVAAFGIANVTLADLGSDACWNLSAAAAALAEALPADADLILLGREFGDGDDGGVPPLVAQVLGRPYFGRVQDVRAGTDGVRLMREAQTFEEWTGVDAPILASVTNDRRNRLRKPLMKNVMMARQARFGGRTIARAAAPGAVLTGACAIAGTREPVACRLIPGAPGAQAAAIAELLRA